MHLGLTFVLAALAAPSLSSVIDYPAANKMALAPRSPGTVSKDEHKVEAKCGGPCGTPFGNAFQNLWTGGATPFGASTFDSFGGFFQSITTVQTTFVQSVQVWQTSAIAFQQFHTQVQLIIVRFYSILQPFIASGACTICGGGIGFLQQFTALFTQFLITAQRLIQIVTVTFSAFVTQFDPIFALLTVCIRTAIGIVATLGGNVNQLIMGAGLNFGLFSSVQISITTMIGFSVDTCFGWGAQGFLGNFGGFQGGLGAAGAGAGRLGAGRLGAGRLGAGRLGAGRGM